MKRPKVAFIDLNHTVYSLHRLHSDEIEKYVSHLKEYQRTGIWMPLRFSDDWRYLHFWNDVPDLIRGLQWSGTRVVTLSNNPIDVQIDLQSNHRYFSWDFMVPLEAYKIFKPNPVVYKIACELLKVDPHEALMITANKDFGDIEGATSIGMPSVWIDRKNEDPNYPIKNLMQLLEAME